MHIVNPALAETLLATYGYVAIFALVMLESAGIPLPGETILVSASIYASTRRGLDIRFVIGAAAAGAILGDNIGFWVGRFFGQRLLTRWGYLIANASSSSANTYSCSTVARSSFSDALSRFCAP